LKVVQADMKRVISAIFLICTSVLGIAETLETETAGKPTETQKTYVLIMSGINKDPREQLAKDKAVMNLRKFFLDDVKVESKRLTVLVESSSSARKGSKNSTAENLRNTMTGLAEAIKPTDRFIFYYVGQSNVIGENLRINLPGADDSDEEVLDRLKGLGYIS